jgi:hypothetical protein
MNHYKKLRDHNGWGAIGCIVLLLILLAVLYAGFQFSRPYIKRSMMGNRLEYLVKWSLENPDYDNAFIIKSVLNAAQELSIDLNPEDIEVERSKERASIYVYWEDEITLPYYSKHLEFEVEATKEAKE